MPTYKCEECGFSENYTVDQLGERVRRECPNQHGRMKYMGAVRQPWYKGHALSSLGLVIILFIVLVTLAGDVKDGTEINIWIHVAVFIALFEVGRLTSRGSFSQNETKVSYIRLAIFFSSTAWMMSITQKEIDDGEAIMLLVLVLCATAWQALKYFAEKIKDSPSNGTRTIAQLFRESIWDLSKGLIVSGISALIAWNISTVAPLLQGTSEHLSAAMISVSEHLKSL